MTGAIDVAVADGIARITLRNSARRNALDAAMVTDLAAALTEADADLAVAVIVLRGADGDFCAGADLGELAATGGPDRESGADAAESSVLGVAKPVIAAVDGNCIGAGVALMLACDIAVASPTARIGVTAARLGVVYPARPTWRLVERVGPSAALHLLLTAERLDAVEALRIGLVDRVHEDVHEAALALATVIAANSRLVAAASKDVIDAVRRGDTGLGEARAARWRRLADESGETAEGIRAFAERRAAQFPWRPMTGISRSGRSSSPAAP